MISISSALKEALFLNQDTQLQYKIEIEDLRDNVTYDVTPLIKNPGKVTRRLEYDTGKFTPGNHSFELMNTKDIGAYILSQYAYLGEEFWMDKVYNIYIGVSGELLHIYTGAIFSKRENRLEGKVSVGSKDITKAIADYQVCQHIEASTIFSPTSGTDNRIFQQVLKLGTHKLINNSNDSSGLKNRSNPFSATMGLPSLYSGSIPNYTNPVYGTATYTANHMWYFPFQNKNLIASTLSIGGSTFRSYYYTSGTVKMYYWDYRKEYRIWRAFTAADFTYTLLTTSTKIAIFNATANGMYVNIGGDVVISGSTWAAYLAGTGIWAPDSGDSVDCAICIESISAVTSDLGKPSTWVSANPVTFVYELLESSRFLNLDQAFFDLFSVGAVDYDYTFDTAYDYMDSQSVLLNVSIDKQVSLLSVLQDICKVSGLVFQCAAKKTTTGTATGGWGQFAWGTSPWGYGGVSSSQDRRIRLLLLEPFSDLLNEPNNLLKLSTREKLQEFFLETNSDTIKDKVISSSFNSSTSTEKIFDGFVSGTGNRAIDLNSKNVYFYNSEEYSEALGQRRLSQLKAPVVEIDTQLDRAGLIIECGDFVELTDHLNNDSMVVQVNDESKDILTGKTGIKGRRYSQLWGPEEDYPCELWAFADYAYACDDSCATGGGFDGHSYYAF